jgi:predicted MFS family arabinose efflux permease
VFHLGWQRTTGCVAVASMMLIVALLPTVSWLDRLQGQAPATFRPLDPIRRLLAIPGMRGLLVATFVYAAMMLCLRSLLPAYLVGDVGMGLSAAGLVLCISQGAGAVGQVFWARLSDRMMTPRTVLAIVGAVACAGALAMASFSPRWSVAAVLIVSATVGFSAAGFTPVILGEVARHSPPGQVGALTCGANLFIVAGAFFGPLTFGGIGSAVNERAAFVVLAIAAALTAAALLANRRCTTDVTER